MAAIPTNEQYQAAYMRDAARVYGQLDELEAKSGELDYVQILLHTLEMTDVAGSYQEVSAVAPFLSALLLKRAYNDMRHRGSCLSETYRFVGDVLLPLCGVMREEPVTTGQKAQDSTSLSSCYLAENHFAAARIQAQEGKYQGQKVMRVYHTRSGEPLLFGKQREVPSALLLRDVQLNGMHVAAGTIVGVDSAMNNTQSGYRHMWSWGSMRSWEAKTYELPEHITLDPLRLSPWAFKDPSYRLMFTCRDDQGMTNIRRAEAIESASLERFRDAAIAIGELCGLTLVSTV